MEVKTKNNNRNKRKWNRAHEFSKRKPTKSTKGHPAYIFAKKGAQRRYFAFTHSETTGNVPNIKLKQNIDGSYESCYVRPFSLSANDKDFEKPSKEYKFRNRADAELIRALQKQKPKNKQ